MTAAGQIRLDGIVKTYGGQRVLNDISLAVGSGEFIALVGPSGCGKSTLLRVVAGLERPDAGRILIEGRDVTGLRAADRDLAMVFQSYALYPHLTARQNMALPLMMRRLSSWQRLPFIGPYLPGHRHLAAAIATDVADAAETLRITPLLDRKPAQMSGGQRQRVALGRAIVRHPKAFLMDEPLSNLDAALRVHTRGEIVDLHRRLGATTIYVTHDQEEALSMADRIVVMMHGRILQADGPRVVYDDPDHIEVARFIGSPAINLFQATVSAQGVAMRAGHAVARLPADADETDCVAVGIRPEHLLLSHLPGDGRLPVRLDRIEFLGSEARAHLILAEGAGERLIAQFDAHAMPHLGDGTIYASFPADRALLFGADGRRIRARAAAPARIVVNG